MDPRNVLPGPGMPFPGWMPPPGTPIPPGMSMGGPPPPGWLPIPPPPLNQNSPHFMSGAPPGIPFQMNPFAQQLQIGRPFLPLGAIPPPPLVAVPNSAPPAASLPPAPAPLLTTTTAAPTNDGLNYNHGESLIPASPTLSQLSSAQNNEQQEFTPRARGSMQSRAQSAGTRSPRARSASSGPVNGGFGPVNGSFGGSKASKPSRNGPGNNNGSSSFGSYGPKSTASPAPSRPQSGSASRNSPKRISSVQSSRRAGSARPHSALHSFGGPAAFSSAAGLGSSSVTSHMPIDDTDNIKVAIRIRPLNSTETARGDTCMLQVSQESPQQVVLTMPASATNAPSSSHWLGPNSAVLQPTTRTFQFHSCIGSESGQEDVIRLCGITQLLDAALDGYNATILAYGQTGSGKTYTIVGHEDEVEGAGNNFPPGFGSGEDEGIVSRSLAYIFSQVEARNKAAAVGEGGLANNNGGGGDGSSAAATTAGDGCKYSIRASYSEIYNEALYDLLCFDQRQLSLRWDPVKGFHAPDLTLQECATLPDAQEVVACGLRHRRVGSHSLNLESSRSHAILTVHIDAVPVRPEAADFGSTRMGKVVFVDLAGSERLKDSHSEGIALRETASINRSLFMLGKVISCLASGAKGSVVPYRESKLTKLLMDSLGGSALSLMIACCSPSSAHLEETLSTLSYATRAKNIKNAPAVQMDPQQAALAALRREIKVLRAENAYLRDQLLMINTGGGDAAVLPLPTATTPNASAVGVPPSQFSPGSSPSPLPAHSVMLPVPTAPQEELSRRLNDAQRLLGTLSSENSRLAAENERLRAGGLQVAGEYSGAVEEIEWLRSKLARLEVSLMGVSAGSHAEGPSSGAGSGGEAPTAENQVVVADDEKIEVATAADKLVAKARATPLPDGYSIDMEAESNAQLTD